VVVVLAVERLLVVLAERLQFQQQAAVEAAVLIRHHGLLAEMVNGF
jgi:hypothetical protein